MRFLILSVSALCGACFVATCAVAQSGQWGQVADRIPPYHTHVDRHLGQNRVYPDRGAVTRDVPRSAVAVNYAGISYRFADGVWFEPRGPAFIVVAPPVGLVVPLLPQFAITVDRGGKTYLYANDVFYRPRPDLGGYEVVNDPDDTLPQRSEAPAAASPAVTPAPLPVATPPPSVAAQVTPPSASPAPAAAAPTPQIAAPAQAPVAATPAAAAPVQAKVALAAPVPAAASTSSVATTPANPTRVIVYPRNGQSTDQQASDRYECYRFAVAESGFDPLASGSGGPSGGGVQRSADYSRAQAACLEGRGYAVQ